ncbi:MarR family winged helix-turn-helix transcriptional regulator [Kribbella monticola]|uniref:MarR family winged helix-turn-helix transcriptional regulator n=1 Tax=Kribbella monticola TaxID=2185285 RepID=UPI0018E569B6|nr:MarR family transcriptional regulator [Kribbella monticola]
MSTDVDPSVVFRRYLSAMVIHSLASAEAAGLNPTDYFALNLLDLAGSLTSGELARRTGLTTGATTRLIDRLEKGGHVRRVLDPADRRKVIVEMVAAPDHVDRAVAGARRRLGAVIGGYDREEQATLFDYFTKAAVAYQESTDELLAQREA